ncbi:MAG: Asp-tRNA(Asn)/Glu-tRNA(Gln) amidotransferase GatCAB subunit B, partial [Nitrolancea sp.]
GAAVGAKVEIKNMNSFRAVERALLFEVDRQREALRNGETIEQETRGWVEDRGVTVSQRTKEFAHDYRYFPEPDLPPLVLDPADTLQIRERMPELPGARMSRFVSSFGLSQDDAALLTVEKPVADYFEAATDGADRFARQLSNWIAGEVFALMRDRGLEIEQINVAPRQLSELVELVEAGDINQRTAKEVLIAVHETGSDPRDIVAERGLAQVSDEAQLEAAARSVIEENPAAVADYQSGKSAAVGFLIGQVMRQMRGTANPAIVRQILVAALENTEKR